MDEILVANERWKAFANLLYTLAASLVAASAARWLDKGTVDLALLSWVGMAFVLGYAGSVSLGFLVPHNSE